MNNTPGAQAAPTTKPDVSTAPPREAGHARRVGWSPLRVAADVVGVLLVLCSVVLVGAGGTALWADRTQRDDGYLTSGSHRFSTAGSALVTVPSHLGSTGTGWLYAPGVLDRVRIKVEPASGSTPLFVGIAPSDQVDHFLDGVRSTRITDFWSDKVEPLTGATEAPSPTATNFWVASSVGSGQRVLTWKPTDGSWTVVVMNADGRPVVDVSAELEARVPALPWLASGLLVAGLVVGTGGVLLVLGAVRRSRAPQGHTT